MTEADVLNCSGVCKHYDEAGRRLEVLRGVEGIGFCFFSEADVVRHPLVQEVVRAYESFEAERQAKPGG